MSDGPTTTSERTGRLRWWRIGQNSLAAAGSRVLSGLCQLVLVPLLLAELGTDTFGWVMALVALVAMSQFADLGVALALQQAISEAHARDDLPAVRRVFESGCGLLRRISLGWLVVTLPAAWWLGPRALAATTTVVRPEYCWLAIALVASAGVFLSAGARLAAGLQMAWIHAAWMGAVNLATVAVVWVLIKLGWATPLVIVVLLGLNQVVPGWLATRQISARLAWRGPATCDVEETRRLWRAGLPMAGAAIAGACVQTLAPAAVARFGGLGASAAFSILQRLFGVVQQGHTLLLGPFWPAYADAAMRGEDAWLRRTLRISLGLTVIASFGILLVALFLPSILAFWLSARAPAITPAFVGFLATATCAGMFAQAVSYLVLGLGRLQRIGGRVAAAHLATLALMIALGPRWGGTGVAAALAAGATLGLLPVLACEAWTALNALAQHEPIRK